MKRLFFLGVALGLAGAAVAVPVFSGIDGLPRWLKAGAYFGSTTGGTAAARITSSGGGCTFYDFPAISNTPGGAATSKNSWDITSTGSNFGDTCSVGTNFGADGGLGLLQEVIPSCQVTATNVAQVRVTAAFSDGGSVDLPDAGWCVRTFSNR